MEDTGMIPRHSPLAIAAALALVSASGAAQTSREKAVAIDRIEAPAPDPFEIEAIGPELAFPWSLAFLPDGSMLVTERHGGLRHVQRDGSASAALEGGPPNVVGKEDSGLLDIVLDPGFAANRTVYLAFVEGTEDANRTAIWKARLDGSRLIDGRVIFRSNVAKKGPSHPGGRMLFLADGTLLLTVGDGYDYKEAAQDPASHLGKVLRLTSEGGVPPGNPFAGRRGHAPEIWTMGHRNIQGLTLDSATGQVWSHEHGPRGGDEINRLEPGGNYGWPRALWGIDYDGKRISDRSHVDGMADPQFFWAPSIAPSGLAIYRGAAFPAWEGRFLVGALAARGLVELRQGKETGLLVEDRRWLTAHRARVRDVRVSPDGQVFLLTDDAKGRIWRLVPAGEEAAGPGPAHPLAPLAFLAGTWSGQSQILPRPGSGTAGRTETSLTGCSFILGNAYLRCLTRFTDAAGKRRQLEIQFRKGKADPAIQVRLLEQGWAGDWVFFARWDDAAQGLVGEYDEVVDGRKVVERIAITPVPDRRSFSLVEQVRPRDRKSDWREAWRWTLTKAE
jgi:glucose/arabinose dehydrogenase